MDKASHSSPNPSHPSPSKPPPVSPLSPRHQSDMEEEDETVKQLKECSSFYLALQDCLIKTDRNWKSCQMEVQALKECNDRRKKDKMN